MSAKTTKRASTNSVAKNRLPAIPDKPVEVTIKALNRQSVTVRIRGTRPLVSHNFSEKCKTQIADTQKAGSTAKSKKVRAAKKPDVEFEGAKYVSRAGWCGIPAIAIRRAMIDACRMVGYHMTHAKPAILSISDGIEPADDCMEAIKNQLPQKLVCIRGKAPKRIEWWGRNANGAPDLRYLPCWEKWECVITIEYDADQFTAQDVINLLYRAGSQFGLMEGRVNGKKSSGMDCGTFEVLTEGTAKK